jgi:hypothetical protein
MTQEHQKRPTPKIDLHPTDWDKDWQPPVGPDLYKNEKPHIWQEFKRDQDMRRDDPAQPIIGRGWPIFAGVLLIIALQSYFAINGDPAWLIAIKNVF